MGGEIVDIREVAGRLGLGGRELISLVGGGGKTTLLFALGEQLSGKVILTTTTKMGSDRLEGYDPLIAPSDEQLALALRELGKTGKTNPPPTERAVVLEGALQERGNAGAHPFDSGANDEQLAGNLRERRVVLVWKGIDEHKALGVAPTDCDRWIGMADYVVVEADGSRRLPFKAPLAYEPVLPKNTSLLIACVGASAFGATIAEACHRPERVAELAGCDTNDPLTPQRLASVLLSPEGSRKNCPSDARFVIAANGVRSTHSNFLNDLEELLPPSTPLLRISPIPKAH